jgi:peptidoglycan-N-acetylglucosamine deacetylase
LKLNRIINFKSFLIVLPLVFISCDFICDVCYAESKGPGAVVLTFDDKYINEWFSADSVFSGYDWKATFCVTKYGTLTEDEKQKLMALQDNGHEIASHGSKHLRATEYLSEHTMKNYLNEEIFPSLNSMVNDGMDISSFVYPYGSRSVETDLSLFKYFSVLRSTSWKHSTINSQKCFVKKGSDEMMVYGLGMDSHYDYFSADFILSLLKYANQEDLAVILYGHNIAIDDTSKYVTSYKTLHDICSFAQQNEMQFLTLRDLVEY